MDLPTTMIVMRMLERLVSVLIGAFSIYLGYMLFLKLPDLKDTEGKLRLPSNISVYLSNVGPGAFFALFGSVLVTLSFVYGVRFEHSAQDQTRTVIQAVVADSESLQSIDDAKLTSVGRYIAHLNGLPEIINPDLPLSQRQPIISDIPGIKLTLIESVWNTDAWGDFSAFRSWVESGMVEEQPNPQLVKPEALNFFNNR